MDIHLQPYNSLEGQTFPNPQKLVLRQQEFAGIAHQDGQATHNIANCTFGKLSIVNLEDIDFPDITIVFTDCFIADIHIETITSKNIILIFQSSILAGNIKDSPFKQVNIGNCILRGPLFLQQLSSVYISYTEENIFPRRWRELFQRVNVADPIGLIGAKQPYYIYNCIKTTITSNWKEDQIGGLYFTHFTEKKTRLGYKLTSDEKQLLDLNISLKYDKEKEYGDTKLNGLTLNSLTISGSPTGKLIIENIKLNSCYLAEFTPKEAVTLYDITATARNGEKSKIEINKSNLDNTWFDNIDFSAFATVSFYRTKFSKTVFTSCTFPDNSITFEKFTTLENIHYPDRKKENYYKDQYEVYLQLKLALEATGNFHEAQKLFAISNDALRKLQEVTAPDKFILKINRLSNNHGLSIVRPFLLLIGFSIVLYISYLLTLGRIFNSNEVDWDLFGYYFSFLDLTHRTDFLVEKSELHAGSLIVDYINKVVVGFFIYQLIASFRKYGKK